MVWPFPYLAAVLPTGVGDPPIVAMILAKSRASSSWSGGVPTNIEEMSLSLGDFGCVVGRGVKSKLPGEHSQVDEM